MHFNKHQQKQLRWLIIVLASTLLVLGGLGNLVARADENGRVSATNGEEPVNKSELHSIFNYEQYLERYHEFSLSSLLSDKRASIKLLIRTKLFIARTLQIFKHNALYVAKRVSYYLAQNKFTDLPTEIIKKLFVSDKLGLNSVSEARSMPNVAADEYMAQFDHDSLDTDDAEHNHKNLPQSSISESKPSSMQNDGLDFFKNPTGISGRSDELDLDNLLEDVKLEPALAKETLKISSPDWKSQESKIIDKDGQNSEQAHIAKGIVRSHKVEPNNPHHEPSSSHSQGIISRLTNFIGQGIVDEHENEEYEHFDLDDYADNESYVNTFVGKIVSFLQAIGIEPNSDYDDEFDEHYDHEDASVQSYEAKHTATKPGTIVYDVDWRVTGCISPPKNQSECNACYVFAVLDLMEFFYCKQQKTKTEFSAQYVIDCGGKTDLSGCSSGRLADVGRFIMTYGVQLNAAYPFKAHEEVCPFDEAKDKDKDEEKLSYPLKPLIRWKTFETIKAWYIWSPRTPMVVGINMPTDFLAYSGGIHEGQNCLDKMAHSMLLVGSGRQDEHTFWLLKNSFGHKWGEAGYFRLSKRASLNCFNAAVVVQADFPDMIR